VFQLGFEGIVCADQGGAASVHELVGDRPREVQAAWARMIDRMLAVGEDAAWTAQGDLAR
jgi:hypothetical protein